jgi:hypothetical protein
MKYLLVVKGDANDGDYITEQTWLTEAQFEDLFFVLKRVGKAIKDSRDTVDGNTWGRSEYSDPKDAPEVRYKGILSDEDITTMDAYTPHGEFGIHSIESIDIHKVESTLNFIRHNV